MEAANRLVEVERRALAIDHWDNDGGAPPPDAIDNDYGQRVETDRSWTVYHVFTGKPAHTDGVAMTGLSRMDAGESMLSLNRDNLVARQERSEVALSASPSVEKANGR